MKKIKLLSILLVSALILSVFSIPAAAEKLSLNVHYKWTSKGLNVMWSKVKGATHYNIKVSRYTNINKNLIVRRITSDSYTVGYKDFNSLNANKLYFVTVAAYKNSEKMGTVKITTKDIEIVGHRGCIDKAPQNTLAGLQTAKDSGYDSVEADFFETSSGEILIFHDDFLNKCSFPKINIRSLTKENLKNYPIKKGANIKSYPTQYIPTLAQYVKAASKLKLKLYLHMKDQNKMSDKAIKKIVSTLKKYDMLKRTVVFSSNNEACKRLSKSECMSGFLRVPKSAEHAKKVVKYAKKVKAEFVICKYNEFFSKSVVNLAHKYKLKIGCHHVSDKTTAARVVNCGADFLIIDRDFLHE